MENNTFIDPASVRYLVFEGGGGKGFAYLGALQAFKHPDVGILKEHYPGAGYQIDPARIDGVAGASAGAIFAALLACGIRYETLEETIKGNKLDNALNMDSKEEIMEFRIPYPEGSFGFARVPKDHFSTPPPAKTSEDKWSPPFNIIQNWISQTFEYINIAYGKIESIKALPSYFGLNSAYNLRLYVNKLILEGLSQYAEAISKATQTRKPDVPSGGALTFGMHYEIMKLPLSIAGFNAEKGELVYFNYKTAPDMAIADAVRISMSIPVYFLPVYIDRFPEKYAPPASRVEIGSSSFSKEEKEKLRGIWVDGGIRANLPAEAFDELVEEDPKEVKANMLLLRVGSSGYTGYTHVFNFITEQIFTLISNTSTIYIRKHGLQDRVIKLEAKGLSMMGFEVEWSLIADLRDTNESKILKRFELL